MIPECPECCEPIDGEPYIALGLMFCSPECADEYDEWTCDDAEELWDEIQDAE